VARVCIIVNGPAGRWFRFGSFYFRSDAFRNIFTFFA